MILKLVLFLGGAFFWTFLEYTIHRGLGHNPKLKNLFTVEHLLHHKEVNYFAAAYKKAGGAIVIVGLLTLILGTLINWVNGFVFSTGLVSMYLGYEFVHNRIHTHAPQNAYGAMLRRHHFYHHFNNPDKNHGVITTFWDKVFGTYVKPAVVIPVPRRSKLKWLVDERGEIYPEFADGYCLV